MYNLLKSTICILPSHWNNDTSITIKEGTVSISPEAFLFCDNLTSVIIPNSVRTIYDQAFGNSGLTEIYCYATPVPETDASAFNMVTTFL